MRISAFALLALLMANTLHAQDRVLFIRGGMGTVGFFEGGSDEHGASIDNFLTSGGNHGWGELSAALVAEGFVLEEVAEDPVAAGVPTPIPLDAMDLNQYSVIVFGSNNAEYTTSQVDALMAFVATGGSALFISDANFGQNWGDAPSSDQHFLSRFGLTMNQDRGTYTVDRAGEFLLPAHPIFNGVDTFDGEGVSPITVSSAVTGVTSTILAEVPDGQQVRRNTSMGQGSSSAETSSDGTLVIATFGSGRIAGHFDRNTFFNQGGAGTNINRFDNEAFARNLFNWLAAKPDFNPATDNYAPRLHVLGVPATVTAGTPFDIDVVAKDPDGSVVRVELATGDQDLTAPYSLTVPALAPGEHTISVIAFDDDGASTVIGVDVVVQDSADQSLPLPRGGWVLSANRNTGELGNAIDGNIGSRWPTREFQQPGQRFGIDFGSRRLFERIVLETPNNPDDYPRGYIVRGSDDGVGFEVLAVGAGDGATTEIVLSEPVTYRHIEIEQTGTSNNRWWSIHEINVYAPPANEPLPLASWLQFHFAESPDDLSEDGDGDGRSTFEEFAANTDPTDAGSSSLPIATAGSGGVDFVFRRWRSDVENGVSYEAESSFDLEDWAGGGSVLESVSNRDGTETVTVRLAFPAGGTRAFARMRMELAP